MNKKQEHIQESLQNIVEREINFEELPYEWRDIKDWRFSKNKTLYGFQVEAIKNAIVGLYLYYAPKLHFYKRWELKGGMLNRYINTGINTEELDIDLSQKNSKSLIKILESKGNNADYYNIENNIISFKERINRMSFWMATGSGKTLIMVKLIEILLSMMKKKLIPNRKILFLSHRNDLLKQFEKHIDEFNKTYDINRTQIVLSELRSDDLLTSRTNVFWCRSDYLTMDNSDKVIDFRDYDNNGQWYVILDEAHKGVQGTSKRQLIYSILSRNGFLFNFSASFVDQIDIVTCIYKYNLEEFVQNGYCKHICISKEDIGIFKRKTDFSEIEKQKIVLKTLLLLTYINKYSLEEIRKIDSELYHKPLMVVLVNSVNMNTTGAESDTEGMNEPDLELFFRELEKVANNEINKSILEFAKEEIVKEFSDQLEVSYEKPINGLDETLIYKLQYEDILKYVLNAETSGKIEVLKMKENKQELVFKLQTSEKPFALVNIGDVSSWLKNQLNGYEITEGVEKKKSYFKELNNDNSNINILMGSRTFYEGWDSNRPNIMLFINIGVGDNSKKFVLQSIGRGVRIEPVKHTRKRFNFISCHSYFDSPPFKKGGFVGCVIKGELVGMETLFIFGTKAKNLVEILNAINSQNKYVNIGDQFILNPKIEEQKIDLLIPVYKKSDKRIIEETNKRIKFKINKDALDNIEQYYKILGKKIILMKYDCSIHIIKKIGKSLEEKNNYYNIIDEDDLLPVETTFNRIIKHFDIENQELSGFKKIEDEIVHFRKIYVDKSINETIQEKINLIKEYRNKEKLEKEIDAEFELTKDTKVYKEKIKELEKFTNSISLDSPFLASKRSGEHLMVVRGVCIKYLANHYYVPLITSSDEKIEYIKHIINVPSEVEFINELEKNQNRIFKGYNWMFSKIDSTVDDIYIPYYSTKTNEISKFKPDFIFWIWKDNSNDSSYSIPPFVLRSVAKNTQWGKKGDISKYTILFVDPKGMRQSDYMEKIAGYKNIFETESSVKNFQFNDMKIDVKLLLYNNDGNTVYQGIEKYWIDNVTKLTDIID